MKKDLLKKICGKVSDVSVRRTVGFYSEHRLSLKETTYFLGFKINHVEIRDVKVSDAILKEALKNIFTKEDVKRVIVKGFKD